MPENTDRKFLCCADCGALDLQDQVWIEVNSEALQSSCESYLWCQHCEDHGDSGEKKGAELSTLAEARALRAAFYDQRDTSPALRETAQIDPVLVRRAAFVSAVTALRNFQALCDTAEASALVDRALLILGRG